MTSPYLSAYLKSVDTFFKGLPQVQLSPPWIFRPIIDLSYFIKLYVYVCVCVCVCMYIYIWHIWAQPLQHFLLHKNLRIFVPCPCTLVNTSIRIVPNLSFKEVLCHLLCQTCLILTMNLISFLEKKVTSSSMTISRLHMCLYYSDSQCILLRVYLVIGPWVLQSSSEGFLFLPGLATIPKI